MANVAPEAPPSSHREEYVLRSGVRSGLKREFVFALKAQAEILMSPMSRTRSGKIQHSPAPSVAAKRRRKSEGTGAPSVASVAPEASPIVSEAVAKAEMAVNADSEGAADETTNAAPSSVQVDGCAEEAPVPMQIETINVEETPPTDPIESGATADMVPSVLEETCTLPETPRTIQIESEAVEDAAPSIQAATRPVVETVQTVQVEAEATADALPSIQVDERPVVESPQTIQVEVDPSTCTLPPSQVDAGPAVQSPKTIPMELDSTADTVPSTLVDARPVVEASQTIQVQVEATAAMVPTIQVDARSVPVVEKPQTVRIEAEATADMTPPMQVEARPLGEVPAEVRNRIPRKAEENAMPENPIRRFTRSLLKAAVKEPPPPVVEESPALMTEESPATSSGSDGLEEIKDSADAVNGLDEPVSITPKKKLELKMSKKIALTKFPSNIRGLLATGLLDGLTVKYSTHGFHKPEGLHGVIKDGGIICFCASCKGLKMISAYNFELHAGSKKKHPSDFIYLENGNTIHDVLRACSSAPLDMLESTIQNAISKEGAKPLNYDKCKESSTKSHIGKLASSCDSSLVPKLSLGSPNVSPESINTARYSRTIFSPKSSDSTSKSMSSQKGSRGRMTQKDLRLHKLVFMDNILPDGTEVAYYARGQRMCEGYIKGSGIFCHCCKTVVSPSLFESHAGCSSRRKPYLNIYTSNGVSLHELSISLSKGKKFSASESDDLCRICADGGDLLLCDLCPRAFHKECVGLTDIPRGDWYCPCCQNMHEKDKAVGHNENAIAAGRVAGVDPIQQIFQRCIRIVKTPDADVGGCVLCRYHDFSTEFGPRTVLLCDQCEREFHVGCLKEHDMGDLKELPEGKWFCSSDCSQIHTALQKLIGSGLKQLPIPQSDAIKKKHEQTSLPKEMDLDVRWRLLSGKTASSETRLLLSAALSIFHGFFQSLFSCIEGMLESLNVKHLVLPAAEEAESIWIERFGFSKMPVDQLPEYMKGYRTMIFEGTSMLHKLVPTSVRDG